MLRPHPHTNLSIATGPVVPSPAPMLRYVDVFLVVQLGVGRIEDAMNDPRLQIQQHSSGNIMLIISLCRIQYSTGRRDNATINIIITQQNPSLHSDTVNDVIEVLH